MNNQEAFDHVLAHMRKQGRPASTDQAECKYRTQDGRSCAAGCLIKDEFYSRALEFQVADSFCVFAALRASGVKADMDLIMRMQQAHDSAARTRDDTHFLYLFEANMRSTADMYDLKYTPPA